MRSGIFLAIGLVANLRVVSPVRAQDSLPAVVPIPLAQTEPAQSQQQVLIACVQGKAETLPIPFTDLSPNHWAFKAVMTMYYCGAFRQATPVNSVSSLKNLK